VLQRARRRSRSCRQFAELPNLVAQIARLGRVDKGVRRYVVRVSNTGKAAVAAAPVQLSVDGVAVDSQSVPLAPGETRTLVFSGPACKRTVRVEADPAKLVAETSEDDNTHELSCS
jgi:subtilase family serine protease